MAPSASTALVVAAAVVLVATGCGGGGTVAPTGPAAPTGTGAAAAPTTDTEDAHGDAHGGKSIADADLMAAVPLGTTVSLSAPGVDLEAKATEVVDPAPGTPEFTPQRDNRFIAVRVALRNVGGASYADTPSSGAVVVTAAGAEHGAAIAPAALEPLGRVELAPREMSEGYLTFEVPGAAEVVELRLTPLSGFGPRAAVWTLRKD